MNVPFGLASDSPDAEQNVRRSAQKGHCAALIRG